jgi:hypothetical protein
MLGNLSTLYIPLVFMFLYWTNMMVEVTSCIYLQQKHFEIFIFFYFFGGAGV